ncbi:hypothetical protein CK203_076011 [Vitis vinifera]|uniref:Uncharacterized protein n=1 Tax=Vitis vinifera TaxID=29760 RepID=A0A438C1I6_VITVI|nr:hypothetical protein CK203_076011 [Vitis vinifera]
MLVLACALPLLFLLVILGEEPWLQLELMTWIQFKVLLHMRFLTPVDIFTHEAILAFPGRGMPHLLHYYLHVSSYLQALPPSDINFVPLKQEQRKHGERGGEIESRRRRFHEVEKKSFGIRCEGIKGWVVCLCFVVEEKKGGWLKKASELKSA